MPLFFNMQVLKQECGTDWQFMLTSLYRWYKKQGIPKSSKKSIKQSLAGNSYLLNPDDFLKDKTTDILWKVQYLTLAAERDYTLYKLYKIKYLDLTYYPDILLDAIKLNPLLNIAGNKVYFKYEEI